MPDRLTIEILGTLHGAAEGRFAIAILMVVALVVTRRLWWPQRDRRRDDVLTPRRDGRESPNQARSPGSGPSGSSSPLRELVKKPTSVEVPQD